MEQLLREVCLKVSEVHRTSLKDRESAAYRLEKTVLEALGAGALTADELKEAVRRGALADAGDELLESVVYGMRREGLVEYRQGRLARAESGAD